MFEHAILDLDGTLVRLPIPWSRFYEELKSLTGTEMKFLEFVSKYFGTPPFWRAHRYLEALELEAVEYMQVYEDTYEFLDFVRKSFKTLAIVTMQSASACMKILEKLGLVNNVSMFVTRECAPTRIDQISLVVKALGIDPSKCIFVGDKVLDGFAAYLNGVKPFIVIRRMDSLRISDSDDLEEDLSCLGVRVVRSLREIIDILKKDSLASQRRY